MRTHSTAGSRRRLSSILLDTDVVSLLMKGYLDPAASGLDAYTWCLPTSLWGEVAKGIAMARWGLGRWTELADWLGHVVFLPIDLRVSYTWGQVASAAGVRHGLDVSRPLGQRTRLRGSPPQPTPCFRSSRPQCHGYHRVIASDPMD